MVICEQAKLSNLGRYQSTRDTPIPNVFRESHCLVRMLVWRNHRFVLLPKQSGRYHNRQRDRLSNFLWPKMDDMDTDNMWFQQNGATCHDEHSARAIRGHGYLARRRCELATEIVRFNAFRLLPLGLS